MAMTDQTSVEGASDVAGEILLAQPRGFCAGVDRAITIVE
jgi:4-hydroxy-3-methylbut-2-enyl diphosphate reductase